MHMLLVLVSTPLIVLGCEFIPRFTRTRLANAAGQRQPREAQLVLLAAPAIALAIGLTGLRDFIAQTSVRDQRMWFTLAAALLVAMGLAAAVAIVLSLVRLWLVMRVMSRDRTPANAETQRRVNRLSAQLGAPRPDVRLRAVDQPVAMTWGLWRPVLLLSTWMLDNLDEEELEAVIAHELRHVARRDFFMTWLSTLLRDAFFYLPTVRKTYRQLRRDSELACDDEAARALGEPLALASALTKIWHYAVTPSASTRLDLDADATAHTLTQSLARLGSTHDRETIEERITQLMNLTLPMGAAPDPDIASSRLPLAAGVALACVFVANIVVMFSPFDCRPFWPICS